MWGASACLKRAACFAGAVWPVSVCVGGSQASQRNCVLLAAGASAQLCFSPVKALGAVLALGVSSSLLTQIFVLRSVGYRPRAFPHPFLSSVLALRGVQNRIRLSLPCWAQPGGCRLPGRGQGWGCRQPESPRGPLKRSISMGQSLPAPWSSAPAAWAVWGQKWTL